MVARLIISVADNIADEPLIKAVDAHIGRRVESVYSAAGGIAHWLGFKPVPQGSEITVCGDSFACNRLKGPDAAEYLIWLHAYSGERLICNHPDGNPFATESPASVVN
jgi:hypothetical protein